MKNENENEKMHNANMTETEYLEWLAGVGAENWAENTCAACGKTLGTTPYQTAENLNVLLYCNNTCAGE
jgi:hypothetical protein